MLELASVAALKGRRDAASDAGTAAVLARAAVEGAALNVMINLTTLTDATFVRACRSEVDRLRSRAHALCDEIVDKIQSATLGRPRGDVMTVTTAIRAPRGSTRRCRGWDQEAALRLLMNNLDPEVAERPDDLIVYGGAGKAARDWPSYHAIVATLERLADDETLLVQSGKPVGVFRTHEEAPRVLIANANLVPKWATWDEFRRLDALGLTMYGQMTAGSWIYIGSQGILQGTYETFAECARQRFGGDLAGRLVVTAGLGGMGGAQPLAVTMNGGVCLAVEVDPSRIQRRLETGYCDEMFTDFDKAVARADEAVPREAAVVDRRFSATPPTCFPASPPRASLPTSSRTRPPRTTCESATFRPAHRSRRRRAGARRDAAGYESAVLDSMVVARRRRCSRCSGEARSCSTTATTFAARWRTVAA